jgi:MFS family permease
LGGLLGLVLGAVVNHFWGWRVAFAAAGAPGLLFAVLVATTLREPRRRLAQRAAQIKADRAGLVETFACLAGKPTFWLMAFAASIFAFVGYGQAQFTSSFFVRTHGPELNQLAGPWFGGDGLLFYAVVGGIIGGLAGAFGSVFGGKVADWATAKDVRAYTVLPAISGALWAPLYVLSILVPTAKLALLTSILPGIMGTFWYGPIYSVAQSVVPNRIRPMAAAVMLFIINIIGLGLGPPFTGAVSDYLSAPQRLGQHGGAQWALIVTAAFVIPGLLLCLAARRTIKTDLVS